MTDFIERTRHKIRALSKTLEADEISLVPTSRDLEAIVDRKFANQVKCHRWFAVISRGEHMYVVADIQGKRVSLQRLILSLAHPDKTIEDFKQVSFENKLSFDCRLTNLRDRVGRQAVMRNRKPKRNTSSKYKGVIKAKRTDGSIFWRGQIKGRLGSMSLGSFEDEEWAAMVYDAAAYLLFNGAGYYNFPELCPNIEALEIARMRIERFKNTQNQKKQTARKV